MSVPSLCYHSIFLHCWILQNDMKQIVFSKSTFKTISINLENIVKPRKWICAWRSWINSQSTKLVLSASEEPIQPQFTLQNSTMQVKGITTYSTILSKWHTLHVFLKYMDGILTSQGERILIQNYIPIRSVHNWYNFNHSKGILWHFIALHHCWNGQNWKWYHQKKTPCLFCNPSF